MDQHITFWSRLFHKMNKMNIKRLTLHEAYIECNIECNEKIHTVFSDQPSILIGITAAAAAGFRDNRLISESSEDNRGNLFFNLFFNYLRNN